MLNTDGTGRDWRLPVGWIAADLASAKAAGARHIFSIGHKPAYEATSAPGDGLIKFKSQRDAFWTSLESAQSEAMFCAHNHCWEKLQPNSGKTFQIIAGNGGSILDAPWVSSFVAPKLPYFGFTLVSMMKDGKVISKSYGRDIPDMKKYLQNADNIPTQVKDSTDITWGQVITGKDTKLMSLEKFEIFPNPINNQATLQFLLPSKQMIKILVFDSKGVEKMVLSNGVMVKGNHELQFNTLGLSSGNYHIQIQGENVYQSSSITVVK